MNDLFSRSSSRRGVDIEIGRGGVQMSEAAGGVNLEKFFDDVEGIKEELSQLEKLHERLKQGNEKSKSLQNAKAVKSLRDQMEADVENALKHAKLVKVKLEALDRSNAANRSLPGCGPGSSSDRTRTSVVNGLRKRLVDSMEKFNSIREIISSDYRDTIRRRYYTVTGEKPNEDTLEALVETGESEMIFQKAIEQQGRGAILDVVSEIHERHDAVKEMERNLLDLHQLFLDISVLVQAQGEQLDDIESQVTRANSYIRAGTDQLYSARKNQKSSRKWTCIAIIILLIVILVILLPIILNRK